MNEASQEFINELLRRLHKRLDKSDHAMRELRTDNASMRSQLISLQADLNHVRATVAHLEDHFDQIERRLELRDFQELAQSPFNHDN